MEWFEASRLQQLNPTLHGRGHARRDWVGVVVMDEAFDMWTERQSSQDYALDFDAGTSEMG